MLISHVLVYLHSHFYSGYCRRPDGYEEARAQLLSRVQQAIRQIQQWHDKIEDRMLQGQQEAILGALDFLLNNLHQLEGIETDIQEDEKCIFQVQEQADLELQMAERANSQIPQALELQNELNEVRTKLEQQRARLEEQLKELKTCSVPSAQTQLLETVLRSLGEKEDPGSPLWIRTFAGRIDEVNTGLESQARRVGQPGVGGEISELQDDLHQIQEIIQRMTSRIRPDGDTRDQLLQRVQEAIDQMEKKQDELLDRFVERQETIVGADGLLRTNLRELTALKSDLGDDEKCISKLREDVNRILEQAQQGMNQIQQIQELRDAIHGARSKLGQLRAQIQERLKTAQAGQARALETLLQILGEEDSKGHNLTGRLHRLETEVEDWQVRYWDVTDEIKRLQDKLDRIQEDIQRSENLFARQQPQSPEE